LKLSVAAKPSKIPLDTSLFIRLYSAAVEETGRTGGLGPIAVQALTVLHHPFLNCCDFNGLNVVPRFSTAFLHIDPTAARLRFQILQILVIHLNRFQRRHLVERRFLLHKLRANLRFLRRGKNLAIVNRSAT